MTTSNFAKEQFWDLVAPAPVRSPGVAIVNGVPAVQTNLFQVGFLKEQFDRRRSIAELPNPGEVGDPSPELALSVLNNWISRYKQLCR